MGPAIPKATGIRESFPFDKHAGARMLIADRKENRREMLAHARGIGEREA